MNDTEEPINRGKTAATSEDPHAKPSLPNQGTPLVMEDDRPISTTLGALRSMAKEIGEDETNEPDENPYDNYQPVAHRLEDLIAETNHQLDRITRIVQVIQILASMCAAACAIWLAAKLRAKAGK